MPRNYERPRMPQNWSGEARNFYLGLIEVLDKLHLPIRKEWLDNKVQEKLDKEVDTSVHYVSEEVQIGTFLGEPLYRIVIEVPILSVNSASATTISTGVTPARVISLNGYVRTNSYGDIPINCYHSTAIRAFARPTASGIAAYAGTSCANTGAVFIMEYTK